MFDLDLGSNLIPSDKINFSVDVVTLSHSMVSTIKLFSDHHENMFLPEILHSAEFLEDLNISEHILFIYLFIYCY